MSKQVKFSETDVKMKQMLGSKKKISAKRINTYNLVFKEIRGLTGLTPSPDRKSKKKCFVSC